MARRDDEEVLNRKLAELLGDCIGNVEGEKDAGMGKRIDVLARVDGPGSNTVRIALELEKYGTSKKAEAVKDAASRLSSASPLAELAIAAIYPKSVYTKDDLDMDTKLTYLLITSEDIEEYTTDRQHDSRAHAAESKWSRISVRDLCQYLPNLHSEIGDPAKIARRLEKRLRHCVKGLGLQDQRRLARSLEFNYGGDGKSENVKKANARNGAKRALLVVAGAALFHTQLGHIQDRPRPRGFKGRWPPMTLDQCNNSDCPRQALLESWKVILEEIDYKPIFKSGLTVLSACGGPKFAASVKSMADWASETSDKVGGLRHDILGRIFHRVLDTAKQDGSFYTSTPAATFLATLAIRDGRDADRVKVLDPSCGTGTLLMAASERIMEVTRDISADHLIDDIIHGVDINTTACHMAATSLGLLSPETNFNRMNMFAVKLGRDNRGKYRTGSLEYYGDDGMLPYIDWTGAAGSQVETGAGVQESWHGVFSLVIMNPPFTRNSLRHDQFGPDVEKKIKKRERSLFAKAPKGIMHSSGPMFTLLAEKLLAENGRLALVLPLLLLSSAGNAQVRKFISDHFHVETVVISYDPKRIWFSENTDISELLLVLTKSVPDERPPTRIVKLAVNPSTNAEAKRCAELINAGEEPEHCRVVELGGDLVEADDWSVSQFYSGELARTFQEIRDGDLFVSVPLSEVADENIDPRGIRGLFNNTGSREGLKHLWPTKWEHETDNTTSMHAVPDTYLVQNPKSAKNTKKKWVERAESAWEKGAYLNITEKVRLELARVFAVYGTSKFIGSAWHPIVPKSGDAEAWSKAMAVYLNSTLGIIAMLGCRTFKSLAYPRWGVDNIRSIPVPVLDEKKIKELADAYERYADADMGRLESPSNARTSINRIVGKVLGVDSGRIDSAMMELAREPMITAQRHSLDTLD